MTPHTDRLFLDLLHGMPACAANEPVTAVVPRAHDPHRDTESATATAWLRWDAARKTAYVPLVFVAGPGRQVLQVVIEEISDPDAREGSRAPRARNARQWTAAWEPLTGTCQVNVAVEPGDAMRVRVRVRYFHALSDELLVG